MANLVVQVSERFPVGTSVGAYAGNALRADGGVAGAAIETATVAAAGTLTYTTLTDGQRYTLATAPGASQRSMQVVHVSTYTPPSKWSPKVAARRAAIGTS